MNLLKLTINNYLKRSALALFAALVSMLAIDNLDVKASELTSTSEGLEDTKQKPTDSEALKEIGDAFDTTPKSEQLALITTPIGYSEYRKSHMYNGRPYSHALSLAVSKGDTILLEKFLTAVPNINDESLKVRSGYTMAQVAMMSTSSDNRDENIPLEKCIETIHFLGKKGAIFDLSVGGYYREANSYPNDSYISSAIALLYGANPFSAHSIIQIECNGIETPSMWKTYRYSFNLYFEMLENGEDISKMKFAKQTSIRFNQIQERRTILISNQPKV